MDITEIWDKALGYIYDNIDNEAGYKAYILKISPESYDEKSGMFFIRVRNRLEQTIINLRYKELIADAVCSAIEKPTTINLSLSDDSADAAGEETGEMPEKLSESPKSKKNRTLNPKLTFENFVVGGSNEFAYTASKNAAEIPGKEEHNPLFLYGRSGVGKTHLMHAIGNHTLKLHPDLKVVYVTSEKFLTDLIDCLRDKCMDIFRHTYRDVNVLMIDDIQFFEKKERIQEELFHTFNELHNAQKQIVLTSDRLPQDLVTLEDRLKTRFASGLTIDISMADYETRIAILQKKAENPDIPYDVYEYIAERIKSNIRELEGALAMVTSFARMHKLTIDLDVAKQALANIIQSDKIIKITSAKVLEHVSGYYSIPTEKIVSRDKTKNIAYARQVAQYICFNAAGMNYTSIAKDFGNCDHTSIMYNVKKIQKLINENNQNTKEEIEQITKNIRTL